MSDDRPSPEQMLAQLQASGASERGRGRLKIFFGYAAGVGKTYAMLQAAQALKAAGVDVVVGYVEPHARPETQALLVGLPSIPVLHIPYRGSSLPEFDLDAALARRPRVILIDELAHTNAPGVRHVKRWQDVEELLDAGIDVFTTVNVQHVESLNDVISQITGVVVRETVPDELIEHADDVALIDLPPDELLQRLQQGKVYIPAQVAEALQRFFRKANLVALRELSLRKTAERVHADVQTARIASAASMPWLTSELLLVCVGPSPTSARVVRSAKRLADLLRSPWLAVFVETAQFQQMAEQDRQRLHQNMQLAEQLGAETVILAGDDVVRETLAYARTRNVTKIVIGKTDQPHRRLFRRASIVDELLQNSGSIDVYLVRGADEPAPVHSRPAAPSTDWVAWLGTAGILAGVTAVAWLFFELGFSEANLVMVYLLGVASVAARFGVRPAVIASVLAVALFDVLFTRPYYDVSVHDTQYVVTFGIMLAIGLLISTLTSRIRRQALSARRNERRTGALYRLSRQLTRLSGISPLRQYAEHTVSEVFDCHAVIFLPDEKGKIRPQVDHLASFAATPTEFSAAQWVFDHAHAAGIDTDTLPDLPALYLPLTTPNRTVAVLAVQPHAADGLKDPETRQLLDTYAAQIAFALERDQLAEQSQRARLDAETEKLRSALLASVSHDLRTPLAAIAGASSALLAAPNNSPETQRDLLETIHDEAHRLTGLVENILHMTRLTSGAVTIAKDWHPVEDIIGSALHRMARQLKDRSIVTELSARMPVGYFDAVLIEQVLINLLDNAVKYSPEGTPIEVSARIRADAVVIEVADRGPGVPAEEHERIFDRFYRHRSARPEARGTGLGLAICKAIVEAHHGTIVVADREGGGAIFRVVLPYNGEPPR